MRAWSQPSVPDLPGSGAAPLLFDTASRSLVDSTPEGRATLYVCGITPYDATHLGHANTYLAFDTLQRVWRDAGLTVRYAQNVTDVDDPLLERAQQSGVDWRELAASQTDLFRDDMAALSILPPDAFIAVTDVIDEVADAVRQLLDNGLAYRVPTADSDVDDVYADLAAAEKALPWHRGHLAHTAREQLLTWFDERGGDPGREGKRDALDPLLWRGARAGEPRWSAEIGEGRPGWHVECAVIALAELGTTFTVQGGGNDLIFPHHEMSAAHATGVSGEPLATIYSHTGMVGYDGEKMSKSLGNLVLVSQLLRDGHDARAIRLALLDHHYRSTWQWHDRAAADAATRLRSWRAATLRSGSASASAVLADVRQALHDDLDTPQAAAVVDAAAESGVDDPALLGTLVHALLGIDLDAEVRTP